MRQAHCRLIEVENYFQDTTTQRFKNLKTSIRPWQESEKKVILDGISKLPVWLKKYVIKEILRGDIGWHPDNPAATIPQTRTIVLFDKFFKSKHQNSILVHEFSHIAFYDFSFDEMIIFARASGWRLDRDYNRTPPPILLEPDSKSSISEDFSNHIEHYYKDPKRLMLFNSMSYLVIQKMVHSKENQN